MEAPSSRSDETEMNHDRCSFLQLSEGISPRLIPLLVWLLRRGHDLQRSQILQVSPVINQSNMSWVVFLWPQSTAVQRQSLDSHCCNPSLCIYLFPSLVWSVKWCVKYNLHHITTRQYRPEKYSFMLYNLHPCDYIFSHFTRLIKI